MDGPPLTSGANMDAAEHMHLELDLIFVKYISDRSLRAPSPQACVSWAAEMGKRSFKDSPQIKECFNMLRDLANPLSHHAHHRHLRHDHHPG